MTENLINFDALCITLKEPSKYCSKMTKEMSSKFYRLNKINQSLK